VVVHDMPPVTTVSGVTTQSQSRVLFSESLKPGEYRPAKSSTHEREEGLYWIAEIVSAAYHLDADIMFVGETLMASFWVVDLLWLKFNGYKNISEHAEDVRTYITMSENQIQSVLFQQLLLFGSEHLMYRHCLLSDVVERSRGIYHQQRLFALHSLVPTSEHTHTSSPFVSDVVL
jgi:hypothetical protein